MNIRVHVLTHTSPRRETIICSCENVNTMASHSRQSVRVDPKSLQESQGPLSLSMWEATTEQWC